MISTPRVAGSSPAGITNQNREKSPLNISFSRIEPPAEFTHCLERYGIKADDTGPNGLKSPGQIPGLPAQREAALAIMAAAAAGACSGLALLALAVALFK